MKTNEIYALNGVEKMTNKEMFIFGINYIANKHNVAAEFFFDDEMVTLSGKITAECANDVKELCADLQLMDKEKECKCLVADCGIDIVFDENWERRVGNKEFEATICKWHNKVA